MIDPELREGSTLEKLKTYEDVLRYFGSQAELARAIGVTKQYVSAWEGEIPFRSAMALERKLGRSKFDAGDYLRMVTS